MKLKDVEKQIKRSEKNIRNTQIVIRVSHFEKELIQKRSTEKGYKTISEFFRKSSLFEFLQIRESELQFQNKAIRETLEIVSNFTRTRNFISGYTQKKDFTYFENQKYNHFFLESFLTAAQKISDAEKSRRHTEFCNEIKDEQKKLSASVERVKMGYYGELQTINDVSDKLIQRINDYTK